VALEKAVAAVNAAAVKMDATDNASRGLGKGARLGSGVVGTGGQAKDGLPLRLRCSSRHSLKLY
jgi:hypothetical protein